MADPLAPTTDPTGLEARISGLLARIGRKDVEARGELFALLYDELHRQARFAFRGQPAGHSLQPTALLNLAFLKVRDARHLEVRDRGHFVHTVARAMQQVLMDHARAKGRAKRGGGAQRVLLDGLLLACGERSAVDVLDLQPALEDIAGDHPEAVEIVRLRFFCGMTVPQVAELLDRSVSYVETRWRLVQALLRSRLG